jgi:uncharacterized protein (DUF2237 family)
MTTVQKNIFGEELIPCCMDPMTGFYRDGLCRTDAFDEGRHVVCAQMTEEFLVFSKAAGNDLSTPRPEYDFPGLKAGDFWCLCALRWKQAFDARKAPLVKLEATSEAALAYIEIQELIAHAYRTINE